MDYNKRDQILFGQDYNEAEYMGGVRYFCGLSCKDAKKLIKLGFLDPNDAQNSAPTVEEMMSFMENYPKARAHGYAVSKERGDVRISFEGLEIEEGITIDLVCDFAMWFHWADTFEVDPTYCYCWYD